MDDQENNNSMEDIRAAKRLHFTIQDGDFGHTEDMGHINDIVDDATNCTYGEFGRQQSTSMEIHSADLSEQWQVADNSMDIVSK
jgi:hypothetical protein